MGYPQALANFKEKSFSVNLLHTNNRADGACVKA
jgi:hypothetical protein